MVEFSNYMVFTKDYRIIETKQNSTNHSTIILNIAQGNTVFFYLYLLEIKKLQDCPTLCILKILHDLYGS